MIASGTGQSEMEDVLKEIAIRPEIRDADERLIGDRHHPVAASGDACEEAPHKASEVALGNGDDVAGADDERGTCLDRHATILRISIAVQDQLPAVGADRIAAARLQHTHPQGSGFRVQGSGFVRVLRSAERRTLH